MYENILVENRGYACIITLNRPTKLNSLNKDLLAELHLAVHHAQTDDSIAGIIITGSGEKAFAAGADIAEFASYTEEQGAALSRSGHTIFHNIENSNKPVIAAVNGFALGGGCELAMSCHIRIASDNARFGQPEVNLGLVPGYGGTQRLIQLIGKGKALELLFTGDVIKADEAHRLGLVNHVCALSDLLEISLKLIDKIASKSPDAIGRVIKCVNDYYHFDKNGSETEIRMFGECFGTADFKEGTEAFINKRTPNFRPN